MTFGKLPIHFAPAEAAEALRADAAFSVSEIAGGPSLFGELATALELPDYFGHNWDALEECLRDLENDRAIVLLVHNAQVRWRRAAEEMTMLVDVWMAAAEERGGDLHLVFVW